MKYNGFENVYHLEGGIIKYSRDAKERGLDNKFIGKNFVFDERLHERITDDVIAECHQCGEPFDDHINCKNKACNLLFIQCPVVLKSTPNAVLKNVSRLLPCQKKNNVHFEKEKTKAYVFLVKGGLSRMLRNRGSFSFLFLDLPPFSSSIRLSRSKFLRLGLSAYFSSIRLISL